MGNNRQNLDNNGNFHFFRLCAPDTGTESEMPATKKKGTTNSKGKKPKAKTRKSTVVTRNPPCCGECRRRGRGSVMLKGHKCPVAKKTAPAKKIAPAAKSSSGTNGKKRKAAASTTTTPRKPRCCGECKKRGMEGVLLKGHACPFKELGGHPFNHPDISILPFDILSNATVATSAPASHATVYVPAVPDIPPATDASQGRAKRQRIPIIFHLTKKFRSGESATIGMKRHLTDEEQERVAKTKNVAEFCAVCKEVNRS